MFSQPSQPLNLLLPYNLLTVFFPWLSGWLVILVFYTKDLKHLENFTHENYQFTVVHLCRSSEWTGFTMRMRSRKEFFVGRLSLSQRVSYWSFYYIEQIYGYTDDGPGFHITLVLFRFASDFTTTLSAILGTRKAVWGWLWQIAWYVRQCYCCSHICKMMG